MNIIKRLVVTSLFMLPFNFVPLALSATLNAPEVVKQGKVYIVGLSGEKDISIVKGTFCKKNVYFNRTPYPGTYSGLMGVDVSEEAGEKLLRVVIKRGDGKVEMVDTEITIKEVDFGVQRIRVPKKWVDYDGETEERVRVESEKIKEVLGMETEERLWDAPFMRPAEGRISTTFGLLRYVNGTPKSPHCGIDIVAYLGTPVLSANSGRVALVLNAYIPGLTVIIDHGQGLYSMYCHLLKSLVEEGEALDRGQEIALVGGTGRITGVHLHYGVILNSNCVDPLAVEKIDVNENGSIFISR
ncbi:MAG: M23 family metallopeptidase [Deltaproteobacteria bacterium]|uniref:M23 family metallopeptidase n=1 Tax=Candidatus Zymogenus saltonus TaxID=2844893 RepID=A0A9D8PNH2_9DELT|nr:M23 family metallopeptidase [Candidatus Zymogenus saltonus]